MRGWSLQPVIAVSWRTSSAMWAQGIQHKSISLLGLSNSGCSVYYDQLYASHTKKSDVIHCNGATIFAGALSSDSTVFLLGAFANSSIIRKGTCLNERLESNGVCWYFKPDKSFGFLDCNSSLSQIPSDHGTTNSDSRLSWNIGNGLGGYRAGQFIELGSGNSTWRKLLYNCPGTLHFRIIWMTHFGTINSKPSQITLLLFL